MIAGRQVTLKSRSQIEQMRRAGRIVADVLDMLDEQVRPGATAADLDRLATEFIRRAGATPSFVGVPGAGGPYRHATCVSLDDEVVHGIPDDRRIESGQIVSIDVGAIVEGWHGDAARSWVVGDAPARTRELVDATRRATAAGVAAAQVGKHIWDISAAIEDVALAGGFGVVREYVGHGIGSEMHEEPPVPNYRTGGPRPPAGARPLPCDRADVHAGRLRHPREAGRLDGLHRGRQPGLALGGHPGHHARRPGSADHERAVGPGGSVMTVLMLPVSPQRWLGLSCRRAV